MTGNIYLIMHLQKLKGRFPEFEKMCDDGVNDCLQWCHVVNYRLVSFKSLGT